MHYIGIDPGLRGAIAVLGIDGGLLMSVDMPVFTHKKGSKGARRELNMAGICQLIGSVGHNGAFAVIERQQAYPGQGTVSTGSTMFGYGAIIGILTAMLLQFQVVDPKVWKKTFGIPRGSTKGASIAAAQRLFPTAELTGPRGGTYDGRADALLLAEYGRRLMTGGAK